MTKVRNLTIGIVWLAALLLAAAVGLPKAHAADAAANEKIVLQVSDGDPKTWNQALNVVRNLKAAYGPQTQIEVVAFGHGIGMVKMDSVVGNRVGETVAAGVPVYACENTMRGQKLSKDDMLGQVAYVPAGIVEIISKQRDGWAVVRP